MTRNHASIETETTLDMKIEGGVPAKGHAISLGVINYKVGCCIQLYVYALTRIHTYLNWVVSPLYLNKAITKNLPNVLYMPSDKMNCQGPQSAP